jgi:hypothetical protein
VADWRLAGSEEQGKVEGIDNGSREFISDFLSPLLSELEKKVVGLNKARVPVHFDLSSAGVVNAICVKESVRYSYGQKKRFEFYTG